MQCTIAQNMYEAQLRARAGALTVTTTLTTERPGAVDTQAQVALSHIHLGREGRSSRRSAHTINNRVNR